MLNPFRLDADRAMLLVIDVQTKRSDNVPFLPIQVVDQGDSSRPVWIILN